uniref:3'-5' exonuclease n=1 Tax=Coccolithus braarudii TaxID=221442 RepID=A0A7S0Q2Q4_9EUKA
MSHLLQPEGLVGRKSAEFKRLVDALPYGGFTGAIILAEVGDEAAADLACAQLVSSASKCGAIVLGFDTETRPVFKRGQPQNPICLVQLASGSVAGLFRLYPGLPLPKALRLLLEDDSVLKVGQDALKETVQMAALWEMMPRGILDAHHFVAAAGSRCGGVAGMGAAFLGLRIAKSQSTTNWEAPQLSEAQMRYAATDAWVCREAYRCSEAARLERCYADRPQLFLSREVRELNAVKATLYELVRQVEASCKASSKRHTCL